ncbi:Tad domain-containing protein [Branchiibius hedensis]|nr:Tad domain-containing protein [Branchiibius hedensis]
MGRDRGSVSIFMASAAFVMIVLVGLAVDLGGQVAAQQRARDVAAQAADRVGAGPRWSRGERPRRPDRHRGRSLGRALLPIDSGVSGTATIQGNDTLVVTTSANYQTKFLSIIGIGSLHVTGHSSARLIRAQNGAPR